MTNGKKEERGRTGDVLLLHQAKASCARADGVGGGTHVQKQESRQHTPHCLLMSGEPRTTTTTCLNENGREDRANPVSQPLRSCSSNDDSQDTSVLPQSLT